MGPKLLKIVVAVATFSVPILAFTTPARAAGPNDMVAWVNTLRGVVSIAPLATDPALAAVAQQWSNQMAATGVLAHNPNLANQVPSGWTKIGENIGDGYSLRAVYDALAVTGAARDNMVNPTYNRTAVAVTTDSHGQVWMAEVFVAYPPPPAATMVFPVNGTVIFPSPQTFSWLQVPGAIYYCLTVGSSQGGTDLLNSGLLTNSQLSYPVPALPGSQPLWARIYSYVQGTWTWTDAKFSATGASTATFTRPTLGATNVDTTRPFTWAPVSSAGYYAVTVGTTMGANDLVNSGLLQPNQTSFAVPALPSGKTLWARVYSYIANSWTHYNDVSFTAAPR
jgi:hypothetical protein